MNKNIALSLLNVENIPAFLQDYKDVISQINKFKVNSELFENILHFDIMDNKFVPSTAVDIEYIKTAKNLGFYVDTHLMVDNPIGDKYIQRAIEYGTDDITIHFEIKNFESVLRYLNEKKVDLKTFHNRELTIGVSVKPNTDIAKLEKYKDQFSKLLIMSVEPGKGGQEFIPSTNDRIKEAIRIFENKPIQIDGGVKFETIRDAILFGVQSFVVGSYLTKNNGKDLKENLIKLNLLKGLEELPKDSNVEFDKKLLQIVPGGYGSHDILLGITAPNTRRFANSWYKYIDVQMLELFIKSRYHEYRRFAILCMSNMTKKLQSKEADISEYEKIIGFLNINIKNIDNWDLIDEAGPNILAPYILKLDEKMQKEKLMEYIENEDIWIKRIGVVSCLTLAKNGEFSLPIYICDKVLYHEHHLIQKATGWVLREIYKKHPEKIKEYLKNRHADKKLPTFVMSYACEKMSKQEKEEIKKG